MKENCKRVQSRGRFDRTVDTVCSKHGRDSGVELKTISSKYSFVSSFVLILSLVLLLLNIVEPIVILFASYCCNR